MTQNRINQDLGKYTPSPWKNVDGFIGTDEEDSQTIAYLSDHRNMKQRTDAEEEANATLIAASPELLEAAIKLANRLEHTEFQGLTELTALKQVIEKALTTPAVEGN